MPDYEKPPVYILTKDGLKEKEEPRPLPSPKPPVSLGLIFALLLAIAAYFVSRSQWMYSIRHPTEQKQEEITLE